MMIGFGSTEVKSRGQIMADVAESLIKKGKPGLIPVRHKYKKIDKAQKDKPRGECLDRYSSFSGNVWEIYEGRMIAELSICHTNRNHALSPDGWAAMFEDVVVIVYRDCVDDSWKWEGFAKTDSGNYAENEKCTEVAG